MVCNAYDFDKTIYNGDSTLDFYKYCIKKYPKALLALPFAIAGAILYILKLKSKTNFKELFYRFLRYIPEPEDAVVLFWSGNSKKILSWYLEKKDENDIIISASPEFLLSPICDRLGIHHLIASRVDIKTGKYSGENCYGEEKVRRFKNEFDACVINEFYSDSLSDLPLARLAQKSFLVEGEARKAWMISQ